MILPSHRWYLIDLSYVMPKKMYPTDTTLCVGSKTRPKRRRQPNPNTRPSAYTRIVSQEDLENGKKWRVNFTRAFNTFDTDDKVLKPGMSDSSWAVGPMGPGNTVRACIFHDIKNTFIVDWVRASAAISVDSGEGEHYLYWVAIIIFLLTLVGGAYM
eukprot:gene23290-1429_t